MRRVFVLLVACVAVAALPVSHAGAHPIKECGNAGTLYDGAISVYNVTTRAVSCRAARRFARRYIVYGGPACAEDRYCRYRGWRCRNVAVGAEIDSRCKRDATA
jgi:hypothetical protein